MKTTHETIESFYSSIERKDFAAVRRLLHDDLEFQGPVETVEGADDLVATLAKLSRLTESFRVEQLFVDGDRACCVYDLITATPLGASPVADYFVVRDGRIASIRAHCDSRPWVALFASGA